MPKDIDLNFLTGKKISEVIAIADEKYQMARQALSDATKINDACLTQKLSPGQRAYLTNRIWTLQKMLGANPLYFSQSGQDLYIHRHYFKDHYRGHFLEIGGYDGCNGSNTYYFEKTMGWEGWIVEALPRMIEKIKTCRSAEVIHAAISNYSGEADFIDITSGYMQMSGLLATVPEKTLETIRNHPEHAEKIIKVPVMTPAELMESIGNEMIDYCSIDVEGSEWNILRDFDLHRHPIKVFSIENNNPNEGPLYQDFLKERGYKLDEIIGVDEIYSRI